ncbi:MAG: nucleoside monophosphate kinase [Cyanobacteria bacterium]|nr:nucleoside monophosphate kinase [Cyanobacteriota bacterium]
MKIKQFILLGPPGAAVQEHAAALAKRWGIPHVSMGVLMPEAIASDTADGDAAAPDAAVMKRIRQRFEQPDVVLKGWVLDGFPRTLAQAQAFDEWWAKFGKPAATVVYLKAMTGLLVKRLSADENEPDQPISAIRRRLERHQEEVAPILEYYRQRSAEPDALGASQFKTINASLSFAEVAAALADLGNEETGAARLIQDEAELDALLAKEPLLVVDCMASWCGSCKQVTPLIDQLAESYQRSATVMKIDFDVNRQITKRFGLKGIPAVMFFKDGELIETLIGVKAYKEYSAAVTRLLA